MNLFLFAKILLFINVPLCVMSQILLLLMKS